MRAGSGSDRQVHETRGAECPWCVRVRQIGPINIGHRGASAYAPENTLAAFELAFRVGAHAIELDVQLSADGLPVVLHDFDVSRTTDGRGAVGALTAAELRALDAGAWFSPEFAGERVPTLEEALASLPPDGMVNVEIKGGAGRYPGIERAVVQVIDRVGVADRSCISSYDEATIERVRALRPDCGTSLRIRDREGRIPRSAALCHCVNLEASAVTAERVDRLHAAGLLVEVYTVNDPDVMRDLLALGVDGVFTDRPDVLAQLLAERRPCEAKNARRG